MDKVFNLKGQKKNRVSPKKQRLGSKIRSEINESENKKLIA